MKVGLHAVLACFILAFTVSHVHAQRRVGGFGGFGGARPATSSVAARPATTTSAAAPRPVSVGAAGAGVSRAGLGASAFRYRPIFLPFALGGLAGYSLASSSSANCNGRNIVCYREACERGLTNCFAARPAAQAPLSINGTNVTVAVNSSGTPYLQLVQCPSSQFGECYRAERDDTVFVCNGRRRPSSNNNPPALEAQCGEVVQDGVPSSTTSGSSQAGPTMVSASGHPMQQSLYTVCTQCWPPSSARLCQQPSAFACTPVRTHVAIASASSTLYQLHTHCANSRMS